MKPFFSVVTATYGRGKHIRPTIESALRQRFSDFELIVVGDGCHDETERVVRSFASGQIKWLNLPENSGSQSFPNNAGIEAALGRWIAYLGHDDIWSSNHLQALHELIGSDASPDVAVSGCVYYGPPESGFHLITGLFAEDEAKFRHFFPPSSIAHRRDLTDRIGGWANPRNIAAPVDSELFLRAAHAGMRFASTGKLTVHKFAAGHRYLSYLCPDAEEQEAALSDPRLEDEGHLCALMQSCKRDGRYMTTLHPDYSMQVKGAAFEQNRINKGLSRPVLMPLEGAVRLEQTGEVRGLDWQALKLGKRPFRWSGPNPRAKILIPYTHDSEVRISLCVPRVAASPLKDVSLWMQGRALPIEIREIEGDPALVATTPLSKSAYSILTIHTPVMSGPEEGFRKVGRRGIAISDIILEPL